jgi:nicotinamidase/pyrazinamidase
MARALLVIDAQRDFMDDDPSAALPVPRGVEVLPAINALRAAHGHRFGLVVLSQDWHPPAHVSFASTHGASPFTTLDLPVLGKQVMWPAHCVQGSRGAELHPSLFLDGSELLVRKGAGAADSYSAFGDAHGHTIERTPLEDALRSAGVREVWVCGLALDYCVSATCTDAARAGFRVVCLLDACRGIAPASVAEALQEMRRAGVVTLDAAQADAVLRGDAPLPRSSAVRDGGEAGASHAE